MYVPVIANTRSTAYAPSVSNTAAQGQPHLHHFGFKLSKTPSYVCLKHAKGIGSNFLQNHSNPDHMVQYSTRHLLSQQNPVYHPVEPCPLRRKSGEH